MDFGVNIGTWPAFLFGSSRHLVLELQLVAHIYILLELQHPNMKYLLEPEN